MALTSTVIRNIYNGDGSTTSFNYTYLIYSNTHLLVQLYNISTGIYTTMVLNTDYTVSNVGSATGGQVAMTVAPAVGYQLNITRNVPYTQLDVYNEYDAFPALQHGTELDLLTMQTQQLADIDTRTFQFGENLVGFSGTIPAPVAGYFLTVNTAGTAFQFSAPPIPGNAISPAANGQAFISTVSTIPTWTTYTLPASAGAANTLMMSNGTNLTFSTASYPATTTINQILYSSAANTVTGISTTNSGILITSAGGVPSFSQTLPSAVQLNIASLSTITTGTWNGTVISPVYGGTGSNLTIAQGDLLYGSAAGIISNLAKNTTATRYISNTGTNNNPAWAQINLANGVTGNLSTANLNSGSGATSATYWEGDGIWAQVNLATGVTGNLGVVNLGSGTSASATTFWRGDASWQKVSLANAVTGNLPVTNQNSGTGATNATFWRGDGTWASPPAGSFNTVLVVTSSGTWSIPADTSLARFKIWGAGGGGGGLGGSAGTTSATGTGGGGAYMEFISSVTPSGTVTTTVGLGGTAGANTGGTGGTGGASSVTGGGLSGTPTANGGSGSLGWNTASSTSGGGAGGTAPSASSSVINIAGSNGFGGIAYGNSASIWSMTGGMSYAQPPFIAQYNTAGAAVTPATGFGNGGCGVGKGATLAGGVGAPGLIIIEYFT